MNDNAKHALRIEALKATLEKRSLDGVLLNVVLIKGEPLLVTYPTEEELDPHEHRIQFLRQGWVKEICEEIESLLKIAKPDASFPKYLLSRDRLFYFDERESESGVEGVTWQTTKWTKDILEDVVDDLSKEIDGDETPTIPTVSTTAKSRTSRKRITTPQICKQLIKDRSTINKWKEKGFPSPIDEGSVPLVYWVDEVNDWLTKNSKGQVSVE